ncbi:MAG: SMP-30/gluconolactonase/LRE family protein [Gemmataceae bacterium]|nr:SMP-30/gluconolactonase/LRE family protein [Gemmata sp.]MDW8197494.1 SMP-30/gluconolactonase/LRE family protein [Gemmataceae bacterium]
MRSTPAQVYIDFANESDRFLPEGPRWMILDGRAALVWVNIQLDPQATEGEIHVHFPDSDGSDDFAIACPGRPGFLIPTATPHHALVGMDKVLRLVDVWEGTWSDPLVAIPDDNPRTIINDAAVVPGGTAVVFGTKDVAFREPLGHLYLYTVEDNRVSILAADQTCSNGKVIQRHNGRFLLWDIDTPTRRVQRYHLDIAARTVTPPAISLDLAQEPGFPDGMCDAGDGSVIIAFYNPHFAAHGRAVRYDLATGEAQEEWTTPGSPRVTCPLLVPRPDGVKLILTTAVEGMPPTMRAQCPNAGCVFVAPTSLTSCPAMEPLREPPW